MPEKPDGQPPFTWLRPVNEKKGKPISVFCANDDCPNIEEGEERASIADGQPRAWHRWKNYILCEDCALDQGAPPVDDRGQGKTTGKPGRPKKMNRRANSNDQMMQMMQGMMAMMQQQATDAAEDDEEDDVYYEDEKNAPDESEAAPIASSKRSIAPKGVDKKLYAALYERFQSIFDDMIGPNFDQTGVLRAEIAELRKEVASLRALVSEPIQIEKQGMEFRLKSVEKRVEKAENSAALAMTAAKGNTAALEGMSAKLSETKQYVEFYMGSDAPPEDVPPKYTGNPYRDEDDVIIDATPPAGARTT